MSIIESETVPEKHIRTTEEAKEAIISIVNKAYYLPSIELKNSKFLGRIYEEEVQQSFISPRKKCYALSISLKENPGIREVISCSEKKEKGTEVCYFVENIDCNYSRMSYSSDKCPDIVLEKVNKIVGEFNNILSTVGVV